jgi:hypothetical protein
LPPFGYALMMVRGTLKEQISLRAFIRALSPFLAAQWGLLLLVLLFPSLTHVGKSLEDDRRLPPTALTDEEFNKRINEMIRLPELDPEDRSESR